jgi:hypothetical protein
LDETGPSRPPDQDEEQAMRVSRDHIEELRAALKKAPEVPPGSTDTTKQEAVRLLAKEIQALQRRGYSLEQVAEMFKKGGLVLTTPTLKSYLSRAKGGRNRRRVGQKAQAGAGAKAPASAMVAPGVSGSEGGGGDTKEVRPATHSVAVPKPQPASASSASDKQEGASPEAPDGTKLRSGKDAFLTKDKASY